MCSELTAVNVKSVLKINVIDKKGIDGCVECCLMTGRTAVRIRNSYEITMARLPNVRRKIKSIIFEAGT